MDSSKDDFEKLWPKKGSNRHSDRHGEAPFISTPEPDSFGTSKQGTTSKETRSLHESQKTLPANSIYQHLANRNIAQRKIK